MQPSDGGTLYVVEITLLLFLSLKWPRTAGNGQVGETAHLIREAAAPRHGPICNYPTLVKYRGRRVKAMKGMSFGREVDETYVRLAF